jgi:hypothetical protein
MSEGFYQPNLKMVTKSVNNVEIPAPYGDPLLLLHELENPINPQGIFKYKIEGKKNIYRFRGN